MSVYSVIDRLQKEFPTHTFLFISQSRKSIHGIPSVIPEDNGKMYCRILLDGTWQYNAVYDDWFLEDIRWQAPELDTKKEYEEIFVQFFRDRIK